MFNELHIAVSQVGIVRETVERTCGRSMKTAWATLVTRCGYLADHIARPRMGAMSRDWLARHDVEFQKQNPDSWTQ